MLGRACAMIFPIRWPEPFGLVMVEAMACGTPVVTTNWGAAPELVDDGVTGFRRDGDDDLVEAIGAGPDAVARRVPRPGRGAVLGPGDGPRLRSGLRAGRSRPRRPRNPRRSDFHYGRSVITLAAWLPPPRHAPPSPHSRSTTCTSPSTTARSCAASRLAVEPGIAPRPDGPERLGQVDPGQHAARQPRLRGDRRAASCSPARTSPRCPPTSAPRRGLFLGFQHPEEIPGVSVLNFLRQAIARAQGHRRLLRARGAPQPHRVDEAPRHGHPLPGALSQRGLLRRREEAQRGPADGDDGTRRRGARRDRLRPRHRRAAPGRGRHRRGPQRAPAPRHPRDHALPAPARAPRPRRRPRAGRRPHRRDRRPRDLARGRGPRLRRVPRRTRRAAAT